MSRRLKPEDVTFTVTAEPEDMPIEGNALASGDDAEDERCYAEIRDQLDRGNEWAWCSVKVAASISVTIKRKGRVDEVVMLEGCDYLGCCSYKNKADFCEPGGYFDDMKAEALDDLQAKVDAVAGMVCHA
jgi:hypothetical protein